MALLKTALGFSTDDPHAELPLSFPAPVPQTPPGVKPFLTDDPHAELPLSFPSFVAQTPPGVKPFLTDDPHAELPLSFPSFVAQTPTATKPFLTNEERIPPSSGSGGLINNRYLGPPTSGSPSPNAVPPPPPVGSTPETLAPLRPVSQGAAADSRGYAAEQVSFTDEDTIENRINRLIQANSPLAQNRVTRANQAVNNRQLLSSSIAVGEAERALYDYAVPIAAQDQQNALTARLANVNARNRAAEFDAASFNQAQLQQRAGAQELEQIQGRGAQEIQTLSAQGIQSRLTLNVEQEFQRRRDFIVQQYQKELDTLGSFNAEQRAVLQNELEQTLQTRLTQLAVERDNNTRTNEAALRNLTQGHELELRDLENRWGTLRQTSQSAAVIMSSVTSSLAQILADPEITPANKQQQVTQLLSILRSQLNVIGGAGNIDLTALFGGPPPTTRVIPPVPGAPPPGSPPTGGTPPPGFPAGGTPPSFPGETSGDRSGLQTR